MNMILILCMPRSGSSMVANIFVNHGCYTGKTRHQFHDGYDTHENAALATAINTIRGKRQTKKGVVVWPVAQDLKLIDKTIEAEAIDFPFLYKTSIDYYRLFLWYKPKLIFIDRGRDQNIKALLKRHPDTEEKTIEIVDRQIDLMRIALDEHGGKVVKTSDIIDGNHSSIKNALEYCGLKYDEEKTLQAINQELWHIK